MATSTVGEFSVRTQETTTQRARKTALKHQSIKSGLTDADREELKTLKIREREIRGPNN